VVLIEEYIQNDTEHAFALAVPHSRSANEADLTNWLRSKRKLEAVAAVVTVVLCANWKPGSVAMGVRATEYTPPVVL
jgi:hypothetical protein